MQRHVLITQIHLAAARIFPMRPALTGLLFRCYPTLYVDRFDRRNCMSYGFRHEDGWFAIVDVLYSMLAPRGLVALQVKEKLGSLRYYFHPVDDWCQGAAAVAVALSGRICEFTGRPGKLVSLGGAVMTVDASAGPFLPDWLRDSVSSLQDRGAPVGKLTDVLMRAKSVQRDVPPGWMNLVDALLEVLYPGYPDGWTSDEEPLADVESIWRTSGGLTVNARTPMQAYCLGAVAFADAIARRIHEDSGCIGPVNDEGWAAWQSRG
jgi:hypothetical protein